MNNSVKLDLPLNPYKRSPIKKREDLAGRSSELKSIKYYLSLTASGQNPHLALIGQRGVGKTSLLNGAEFLAKDLKLLCVRVNMNEQKANSLGRFWHDLYQSLALSMVKAGCWGGLDGTIYAELLRMIYARVPGSLDKAVMQMAYVFSCHQGSIDNLDCPDSLVVHDFEICLKELDGKGLTGIALLIDEADCLGKNVPLLQMIRNIFQELEYCSLILAGTEAVFPALSEVFSPIPRQFHRIDINPFARWSDTMDLVYRPLPKDTIETIAPLPPVLRQLHELCGGAPDEVQLYCHHMYRGLEDGSAKRMTLDPQVFREVLREYRSNSSANLDTIIKSIERLPDNLLFESEWLARKNLMLEENIRVSVLREELENNTSLSDNARIELGSVIADGYRRLFELKITERENSLTLCGAPLTAGFWKSFVEVERGKRWTWSDGSFADHLCLPISYAIGQSCGAVGQIIISQPKEYILAIQAIRDGRGFAEFDSGMSELISSALFALDLKSTYVADLSFQIDAPFGKKLLQCRFYEDEPSELRKESFQNWIEKHTSLLNGNDISVEIIEFYRWELPSALELHRLGRVCGFQIPDAFGPTEGELAVAKFGDGDTQGCIDTFLRMLEDKPNPHTQNNLAFCQILTGNVASGIENLTKALAVNYEPLFALNMGIAEFLNGQPELGKNTLREALDRLQESTDLEDLKASYVLVLDPQENKANPKAALPVNVAISLNLWLMGGMSRQDFETSLVKLCPDKAHEFLATFPNYN